MQRMLVVGLVLISSPSFSAELEVGYGEVDITPYDFEVHNEPNKDGMFWPWKKHLDTGVDRKYDFEEDGAFGDDLQPGRAGVDDDGNGKIDDCTRAHCREYLATGSDDRVDPAGDNYHKRRNRTGTEGDRRYQNLALGGFAPWYPPPLPARYAMGIHDPIWSRAIYVRGTNGVPVILVTTDLPGLGWKTINPIRRRVEWDFKIPRGQIIITSTHNHAAPDGIGYWSSVMKGHMKWYMDRLKEQIYESIVKAIESREHARMKTITTTHISCYDPKTLILKKDPDCNLPPHRGAPGNWDRMLVQGDSRDPVVRNTDIVSAQFVSKTTGKTITTFVNWATHPDALKSFNALISSDYPHYIRHFVETKLGGRAAFFIGTQGNQIGASGAEFPFWNEKMERVFDPDRKDVNGNPFPKLARTNWDRIRSMGYEVGHEVVQALKKASFQDEADVRVKTEPIHTQVTNALHVLATAPVWRYDVEFEDRMRKYRGRCSGRFGCVQSDISVIQIGDLGLVTAPGEMDPAYLHGRPAIRVDYGKSGVTLFGQMDGFKKYMPGRHHAVLGQGHNYLSYLIHRTDNHGWWCFGHPNHYEEFVTTDKNLGDDVGNKIMQMLGSPYRYSSREILPFAPYYEIEHAGDRIAYERTQQKELKRKPRFGWIIGGFLRAFGKVFGTREKRERARATNKI